MTRPGGALAELLLHAAHDTEGGGGDPGGDGPIHVHAIETSPPGPAFQR